MRILKALLLPFLLILSLIGVDRLSARKIGCSGLKTCGHPALPQTGCIRGGMCEIPVMGH
ncbi:hypothetical protein [Pseudomonas citri]|uniref:hypothetical protein n=1 Tax=Pseudomonas citri TaxID=2978349 RepID=UPI0021B5EF62|nr:hypothetical protein [Pseudomonas citri]